MSNMTVMSRVSVRAICLGEDIRATLPLAKAAGYRGVQLDVVTGGLSLNELDGSGRREVRHLVSSNDLEVESVRAQVPAGALATPADHDRLLWMMRKAIEATSGIGAKCLCVDIGRLPRVRAKERRSTPIANPGLIIVPEMPKAPAANEPEIKDTELALWDGVDVILREIGSITDRIGVVVAFAAELSGFASLERMLEGARCPWFGVDLDPVSVLREDDSFESVLDVVGPMLRHVRVRDAIRGSGGRTQPAEIGEGSTNWRELLSLLDSGSFGGWLAVDTVDLPSRVAAARRAPAVLAAAGR